MGSRWSLRKAVARYTGNGDFSHPRFPLDTELDNGSCCAPDHLYNLLITLAGHRRSVYCYNLVSVCETGFMSRTLRMYHGDVQDRRFSDSIRAYVE